MRQTEAKVQDSVEVSDHDTDDAISFTSFGSDHSSIGDNVNNPIVNLWIDGEILSVKRSTLCIQKNSCLAENFSDDDWVKKHTLTTEGGIKVILMGYSSVILSIINQPRLRSMRMTEDELPDILEVNKVESAKNIAAKLFPGNEKFVLGKKNFDSEIITSRSDDNQLMTWLGEVNKSNSKPKLLYRASRDGWTTESFHSLCDDHNHTLVTMKTSEGYVFGGYSDQSWEGNEYKSSSSSFLFSLKCYAGLAPTRMKVQSGEEGHAVRTNQNNGPCFSGDDLWVGRNNDMKQGYTNPGYKYEIPSGASNTFLAGKADQWFDMNVEVEVFGV